MKLWFCRLPVNSMALLEAKKLVKNYTADGVVTLVLKEVSLSVQEKEFVSIMGASGSGKSTLMHILGLLDRPTDGAYFFDGQNINDLSDEALASIRNQQIGFVFQAFHLLPRISVLENIVIPLQYSRVPKQEWPELARQALERVGMSHRANYRPTQLSGGEKQRTAIARALIVNPKLILADEPTGNLDSTNGQAILQLLKTLNETGHTVVLVTHDLGAARIAGRIVTMRDGLIISDEPVVI